MLTIPSQPILASTPRLHSILAPSLPPTHGRTLASQFATTPFLLTESHSTAARAAFTSSFKKALWLATTALPFVFSSYHRKAAVFYLPPQWFGPLQWFLALPSAPTGAVACGIWTMAVKRTVGAVKEVVGGLMEREAKVPVPVGVKVPGGAEGEKIREKNEL